jgi:hypothetical protein
MASAKKNKGKKGKPQSGKRSGQRNGNTLSKNPMSMGQPNGYPRRMKGAKGTGLSHCAEIFAKALVNPFGEFDELPCVPCAPSDMTYKFRNITRGSFSTSSTTGVGFVSWAPQNPANDVGAIFASGTGFTGTSFATTGVGVSAISKQNMPFTFTQIAGGAAGFIAGRLVASGIRVKNTTANLYKQGSILACRLPTGSSLAGFNAAQLGSSIENVKEEASRNGWFCWNYIPQDQEDLDFVDASTNYSTSPKGFANFGLLVQGAALSPNNSTFDYEIVEFWEFTSSNPSVTLPSLTKTHADSVGLDRVVEAVSVPVQTLAIKDIADHVSRNIVDSMAHSDSAAKTVEDLLGLAGLALPAINQIAGSLSTMLLL